MKYDPQQGGRMMRGMKPMMLLCALGALLVSGCASQRVVTNLKPGADPALKSPAGRFYVAGLKYAETNPQVQQNPSAGVELQQKLLPMIRKECVSRYPGLFAEEASGSIPLGVEMTHTFTFHNGVLMAWELGTACICGLILPCPGAQDDDYLVKAGVWNGRDGIRGASIDQAFREEVHIWISLLTPSALITIPGESDFPKFSGTIFSAQSQMETGYQQLSGQVATALAQLVATKEPEFWTAAPVSMESTTTTLPSPTTTLPPPAPSAAPF